MHPDAYHAYTHTLTQTLAADDRVVGLVALGSMADATHRDTWSDHDFWVITVPGAQEAFLSDLSWLPSSDAVAIALRQALRYYTVLYHGGHVAEFAVFDAEQMAQGTLNTYEVLIDRADVIQRAQAVSDRVAGRHSEVNPANELGHVLVYLWVGLARYWRGERLSSHKYLTQYALDALLSVIAGALPPVGEGIVDSLDPRRRSEVAYPDLAAELDVWSFADPPLLATRMLDVADRWLAELLPDYPHQVVDQLRQHILANTRGDR